MATGTTKKKKTYASDEDYITKHISYHDFGAYQMSGTFVCGDGFGFSAMVFKEGRGTKKVIADSVVKMVLRSGRPVRGYYHE